MLSAAGWAHACAGFKFIGNTALNLEKEGYEVPFGYEEAIGFMFGSEIRDKDGVAATVRGCVVPWRVALLTQNVGDVRGARRFVARTGTVG